MLNWWYTYRPPYFRQLIKARSTIYSQSKEHPPTHRYPIHMYHFLPFLPNLPATHCVRHLALSINPSLWQCPSVCTSPADISKWINYNSWCLGEGVGVLEGWTNWLFSWRSSPDNNNSNWQHEKAVHLIRCCISNDVPLCAADYVYLRTGGR
jgi:hypothetical protein